MAGVEVHRRTPDSARSSSAWVAAVGCSGVNVLTFHWNGSAAVTSRPQPVSGDDAPPGAACPPRSCGITYGTYCSTTVCVNRPRYAPRRRSGYDSPGPRPYQVTWSSSSGISSAPRCGESSTSAGTTTSSRTTTAPSSPARPRLPLDDHDVVSDPAARASNLVGRAHGGHPVGRRRGPAARHRPSGFRSWRSASFRPSLSVGARHRARPADATAEPHAAERSSDGRIRAPTRFGVGSRRRASKTPESTTCSRASLKSARRPQPGHARRSGSPVSTHSSPSAYAGTGFSSTTASPTAGRARQ